jgi:hypothetical protein
VLQVNNFILSFHLRFFNKLDNMANQHSVFFHLTTLNIETKIVVETGPPVARHRERNSFKFFGADEGKPSNELLVTSPKLSSLYNSTATFRVKFDDSDQGDLVAKFQISRRLHVNETKCK